MPIIHDSGMLYVCSHSFTFSSGLNTREHHILMAKQSAPSRCYARTLRSMVSIGRKGLNYRSEPFKKNLTLDQIVLIDVYRCLSNAQYSTHFNHPVEMQLKQSAAAYKCRASTQGSKADYGDATQHYHGTI